MMTYQETWEDMPPDDAPDPFDFDGQVLYQMHRLRVTTEAKRRLDVENQPLIVLPEIKSLADLLAEPDEPTQWLVEDVAPIGSRIMLSAQYKSGKSTLRDNLIRSLVDGVPFLGRFDVCVPPRRVAVIDDELSPNMIRRWLGSQGIKNTEAVSVVALRGRVGSFNVLDERCRAQWANCLRQLGIDYLIFDCLRPALDALGLSEDKDAGKFLVAFDALLDDAGIPDAAIVHHMGHSNERARGDSRLQDWPDAIWRMVRHTEEPNSARFFSAFGRDVDVPEGRLTFDPQTRHMTYTPGSRADMKSEGAMVAVIEMLAESAKVDNAGMSGREIEESLTGLHTQKAIRDGAKLGVDRGLLTKAMGSKRAQIHRIANPCNVCGKPVAAGGSRHKECGR